MLVFPRVADMQYSDFFRRIEAGYFKSAVEFREAASVVGERCRDIYSAEFVVFCVGILLESVFNEVRDDGLAAICRTSAGE